MSISYLSPKAEKRSCPEKGGFGLFARVDISSGELLCVWGGAIYRVSQLDDLDPKRVSHGIQVEDELYLIPSGEEDSADYVNHSCAPNAGLSGQISLVAMRNIAAEEEICFDYAMSDSSDYDEFECQCGTPNCRRKITGNDWKLPELRQRYQTYFAYYLQKRIIHETLSHPGKDAA